MHGVLIPLSILSPARASLVARASCVSPSPGAGVRAVTGRAAQLRERKAPCP